MSKYQDLLKKKEFDRIWHQDDESEEPDEIDHIHPIFSSKLFYFFTIFDVFWLSAPFDM